MARTPKQLEDLVLTNLRQYQTRSHITQAEMAVVMQRLLGGTWDTGRVWRVLQRKVTPDLMTMEAAAQSLGLTLETLLRADEDEAFVLRHVTREEAALLELLRRRGPEVMAALWLLLTPEAPRRHRPRRPRRAKSARA